MFAPIIIFAFNRIEPLKETIRSLQLNEEAKYSDLFVFVDGARKERDSEKEIVNEVQTFVENIQGFKSLSYFFSHENKGLSKSIIAGVSKIMNQYGVAIIIEDDLILTTNFLAFMNKALVFYKDNDNVFSVCGYTNQIKIPDKYSYDAYFCTRSSSWGWATWIDRWKTVDWELNDWPKYMRKRKVFNQWGGSDCFKMLNEWKQGINQSWAIRFCFSQFLQNKLSVFPITSKVKNNGFDGNGTHCKRWTRFKTIIDSSGKKEFDLSQIVEINPMLYKSAMSYHNVLIRIWSKIMYYIH